MKVAVAASSGIAALSGAYMLSSDSWGKSDMLTKLDSILGGHFATSKKF